MVKKGEDKGGNSGGETKKKDPSRTEHEVLEEWEGDEERMFHVHTRGGGWGWTTDELNGHHHYKRGSGLKRHHGWDSWVTSSAKDSRGIMHHHHRVFSSFGKWEGSPPCYIGELNYTLNCSHDNIRVGPELSVFQCLDCGLMLEANRFGPPFSCLILREAHRHNSPLQKIQSFQQKVYQIIEEERSKEKEQENEKENENENEKGKGKGKGKEKEKGKGKGKEKEQENEIEEEKEKGEGNQGYKYLVIGRKVIAWGSWLDVKFLFPSDAVACGLYTFEELEYTEDSLGIFRVSKSFDEEVVGRGDHFSKWMAKAKSELIHLLLETNWKFDQIMEIFRRVSSTTLPPILERKRKQREAQKNGKEEGDQDNFNWCDSASTILAEVKRDQGQSRDRLIEAVLQVVNQPKIFHEAFSKWKKSGEFSIVIEGEGGGRKKSVTEWEVRLILPLLTTGLCSQIDLRGIPFTRLPFEFELLDPSKMRFIYMDADKLKGDEATVAKTCLGRQIIEYVRSLKRGTSTFLQQMKLVLVGAPAVGKTSLVRVLAGTKFDPQRTLLSTDGIDLGTLQMDGITFHTWDFAGQRVYRYTHQLFLTQHALYLVIVRLIEPVISSYKEVIFWINSILSRVEKPQILLIGTHVDRCSTLEEGQVVLTQIEERCSVDYGGLIAGSAVVSCADAEDFVDNVRELIVRHTRNNLIRAPALVEVVRRVVEKAAERTRHSSPIIPTATIKRATRSEASRLGVAWGDVAFQKALSVLHQMGVIVLLRAMKKALEPVVVVRPSWLTNLLATIITTKRIFINRHGLLAHEKLPKVWDNAVLYPQNRYPLMIELLKELDIFYPLQSPNGDLFYFIPCLLPDNVPNLASSWPLLDEKSTWCEYSRLYTVTSNRFLPDGLAARMLVNLLRNSWMPLQAWRKGFVLSNKSGYRLKLRQLSTHQLLFQLRSPSSEATHTLSHTLQSIVSLLYVNLSDVFGLTYGITAVHKVSQEGDHSPVCEFDLQAVREAAAKHEPCECSLGHQLLPHLVAPDITFEGAACNLVTMDELFIEKELGVGSFGAVYLATLQKSASSSHPPPDPQIVSSVAFSPSPSRSPSPSPVSSASSSASSCPAFPSLLPNIAALSPAKGGGRSRSPFPSRSPFSRHPTLSPPVSPSSSTSTPKNLPGAKSNPVQSGSAVLPPNSIAPASSHSASSFPSFVAPSLDEKVAVKILRWNRIDLSTQTKAISPHESESEDDSESESIESEEESGDELLSSNLSASSTTYSDLNDSEAPSFFSQTVPSSERALSPSNSAQLAHHPNSLTPSRPSSLCTMSSPAIVPTPPEDSDSEIDLQLLTIISSDSEEEEEVEELKNTKKKKEPSAASVWTEKNWAGLSEEIWTMNALNHPNVIGLRAICLHPPAIVLEAMFGGELYQQLHEQLSEGFSMIDFTKDLTDIIARHYTDVTLFAKKSYSLCPLKEMPKYHQLKDEREKWRERVGKQEGMQKELQEVWKDVKGALLNFYKNPGNKESFPAVQKVKVQIFELATKHGFLLSPMDWTIRFKLVLDIAAGMAYLHSLNPPVLHRDLKTPNILLSHSLPFYASFSSSSSEWPSDLLRTPMAKIADFGLSRRLFSKTLVKRGEKDEQTGEGGDDESGGEINPRWSSPEVLGGSEETEASDVYAFGVVLWEIMARKIPFKEETEGDSFFSVDDNASIKLMISERRRPKIPSSWPLGLANLINECWAHYPSDRPTMGEIFARLIDLSADICPHVATIYLDKLSKNEDVKSTLDLGEEQQQPLALSLSHSFSLPGAVRPETLLDKWIEEQVQRKKEEVEKEEEWRGSGRRKMSSNEVECESCEGMVRGVSICSGCQRRVCQACCVRENLCFMCEQAKELRLLAQDKSTSVRVQCMTFACGGQELWMGLRSGRILSSPCSKDGHLLVPDSAWSLLQESHPVAVNAMVKMEVGGTEMVWTGSEDGSLKVWSCPAHAPSDVVEVIRLAGWVRVIYEKHWEKRWGVLESGRLQFFKHPIAGKEERRYDFIDLRSIKNVSDKHKKLPMDELLGEDSHLTTELKFSRGRTVVLRAGNLSKWNLLMMRIYHALKAKWSQQSRFIFPIAEKKYQGLLTMAAADNGNILLATEYLVILEVHLVKPSHLTGLRTYSSKINTIRPRMISQSFSEHLAGHRANCILSIDEKITWVALGGKVCVLGRKGVLVEEHKRAITAMLRVHYAVREENVLKRTTGGEVFRVDMAVWTGDNIGQICIWHVSAEGIPLIYGTLQLPTPAPTSSSSFATQAPAISCMYHLVEKGIVLVGTSTGEIHYFSIHGKYLGDLQHDSLSDEKMIEEVETESDKGKEKEGERKGHENVVTSLVPRKEGEIWSGSWDEVVILWEFHGNSGIPRWDIEGDSCQTVEAEEKKKDVMEKLKLRSAKAAVEAHIEAHRDREQERKMRKKTKRKKNDLKEKKEKSSFADVNQTTKRKKLKKSSFRAEVKREGLERKERRKRRRERRGNGNQGKGKERELDFGKEKKKEKERDEKKEKGKEKEKEKDREKNKEKRKEKDKGKEKEKQKGKEKEKEPKQKKEKGKGKEQEEKEKEREK